MIHRDNLGKFRMLSSMFFFPGMRSREGLREAAPGILIVAAIGALWTFGDNGVWQRLQLELDGRVLASQDFP